MKGEKITVQQIIEEEIHAVGGKSQGTNTIDAFMAGLRERMWEFHSPDSVVKAKDVESVRGAIRSQIRIAGGARM